MRAVTNHSYFPEAFKHPYEIADQLREETKGVEYGSLVGIGLSGSVMIPMLGLLLDLPFAILRKEGVSSHAHDTIFEGTIAEKWLFVDDFIGTGATYASVVKRLGRGCKGFDCVGSFEYTRGRSGLGLFKPYAGPQTCLCGCGMPTLA